jgi:class 3 adenylate cyclase/tetratricopeptide (TPR) repeat protein
LGLAQYAESFAANDIDYDVLRDLTNEDLIALGVSLGHRKKILRSLREMEAGDSSELRDATEPAKDDGERRQISVMFCDLVGSTALAARLDPEDMRELIRSYHAVCTSVVPTYDGLITRFMGDGILACFGYPRAHEDDAERAVRAGLEIIAGAWRIKTRLGVRLDVRVGIATGLVVIGDLIGAGSSREYAMVGETPNLAARLEAVAEPGTVVIAASTRRLLGDVFSLRELGHQSLKGFAQPVEAWAVEGLAVSESRFEAVHAGQLTEFVDRALELDLLLERKKLAWRGQGQIGVITGEAGIGKSRLAMQLIKAISSEPCIQLRHQCSPYHSNSAFYPFITQLERAAMIRPEDTPDRRLDKLEAMLANSNPAVSAVAPLFAALLSVPFGNRYQPLTLSAAQQRRLTIEALIDHLESLCLQRPVLFIFEDMHWADATSLEVLDFAVERMSQLPIMMLVTFRPDYEPTWQDLPNVTRVPLGRLEQLHVRMMVDDLTGGRMLPAEVMDQIIVKTDGVPLFVEELTKTVLETGIVVEEAAGYRLDAPLPPLAIPATLHDSLMARLDRLAPVKEIAQIGAAIGREFSYRLLSTVTGRDETTLRPALARLEETELLFRSGDPPDAIYSFKHALVRDTAYESLLKSRRQILHEHIAQSLRDHFPGIAENEPEIVAHHFTQSGLLELATAWWVKAAEKAQERGAYLDAKAHLMKALDLAARVDDASARQLLQLKVLVAYGTALMASNGYLAPETVAAFTQARQLAVRVEDVAERCSVYYGLWAASYVGGHVAQMRAEARTFLLEAKNLTGSREEAMAYRVYGATCWFEGDYIVAREHLLRARAVFDATYDDNQPPPFGVDTGVTIALFLALVLWPLGDVEEAKRLAEAAMTRSQRSGHAHTLNYAHFHKFLFDITAGDLAEAMSHANAFYNRVRDQGTHQGVAWGSFVHGWAKWHMGDHGLGEAEMRRSLALMADEGLSVYAPILTAMLAEVEAASDMQAGVRRLDEALIETERSGQRWFDAELQRRRGELLLRCIPPDHSGADAAFSRAMEIARAQQTKVFELRARLSAAKARRASGLGWMERDLLVAGMAELSAHLLEVADAKRLLASSDV